MDQTEFRGNQPKPTAQLKDWLRNAPAPVAIEPDLPIVDPHHHLFGTKGDSLYYTLDDLQRDVGGGHRVLGTVYVEAYDAGWRDSGPEAMRPVGEVERIVGLTGTPLATGHGACQVAAGIVGFADLTLGARVAEVLEAEAAAGQGRLRGIRARSAWDGSHPALQAKNQPQPHMLAMPEFRRGVAELSRFGLSFDAWVYHTQLDEVIDLADTFPDTVMIVDHVGGPIGVASFRDRHDQVMRDWGAAVRRLAERPNVRMKVGGMGMPVFGFGFEHRPGPAAAAELAAAWKPYVETCVEAFGTARCMFESNSPVDKQSASYVELWNGFKLLAAGWSAEERRDLFYRTACRTYRLPALEAAADAIAVPSSGYGKAR